MGLIRKATAGVLNLLTNPLGQRTDFAIISDRPMKDLRMKVNANVTVSVGTASGVLQNRGSILSYIRNLYLLDGPTDVMVIDGRVTKIFAEMLAPRTLADFNRFANGAAQGPTTFYEGTRLGFGCPIFAVPRELFYKAQKRLANGQVQLKLGFETVPDIRAAMFTGNDRTFVLNSLTAELIQHVDPVDDTPPQFDVVYQRLAQQIVQGALNDFDIPLNSSGDRIAAIVVAFSAGGYEVSDILTSLSLVHDNGEIIGKLTDATLSNDEQNEFGGSFPIPGYHAFSFVDGGKWSNAIDPLKCPNLRLKVNVPGVSATAGQNLITVWGMTLRTVPGITKPAPATK